MMRASGIGRVCSRTIRGGSGTGLIRYWGVSLSPLWHRKQPSLGKWHFGDVPGANIPLSSSVHDVNVIFFTLLSVAVWQSVGIA